ncbi:hypothetical protein EV361DRAFT_583585 [Lentinula raphanica]|uniref:Transmembrane protein n=1 Tax=Lentinula raphanica TaxID=153919 RepID=A0AA38ULS6_9AGAR|nr:hypothetical protein F5880DRAFT_240120 [Lentinula raphanica]KAJ3843362.1 hypothetical protein F5878DRAFT_292815 [Lentinula raphanica]KAJ3977679.1 hypothetical protein EV361DRAFT_583585 [Lentinula raphanica]
MTQLKEETQAEERQGLLDREVEEVEEEEDAKGPVEEEEEAVVEEPAVDSRFHQPTPSPFKRILLLLFIGFLFWFAFVLGRARVLRNKKPQIIYANRYSAEHKFRPAASPIITETLKDGRLRIRGAGPTASATPTSTPTKVQKRKTGKKKLGKKSKRAKKFKGASK